MLGAFAQDVPMEEAQYRTGRARRREKLVTLTGGKMSPATGKTQAVAPDFEALRHALEERPSCWPPHVQRWRVLIYLALEEPRSSIYAKVVSGLMLTFILLSITSFTLETMPELKDVPDSVWLGLEVACTFIFTVEYVSRLLVCDVAGGTVCAFVTNPLTIADLLSILPFLIWLVMRKVKAMKALGVLRIIRLVRLLRIFKLGRYSWGMQLVMTALRNSSQALRVLFFFLSIAVVLFSSVIYYVEKMECPDRSQLGNALLGDGSNRTQLDEYLQECRESGSRRRSRKYGLCCDENDSPLDFNSIVEAFWWSIVTMTTVGFGDTYPRTDLGKIVGTVVMLTGILLIALPIAIIGRKFQDAYDDELPAGRHHSRRSHNSDVPSLNEMGRRMRMSRMPDHELTMLARELGSEFEEQFTIQKEIFSMHAHETTKQEEILDHFDGILDVLCEACGISPSAAVQEEKRTLRKADTAYSKASHQDPGQDRSSSLRRSKTTPDDRPLRDPSACSSSMARRVQDLT